MAAYYHWTFDCGYVAKVKGSSAAAAGDHLERYMNIFVKPEANKLHQKHCQKCV